MGACVGGLAAEQKRNFCGLFPRSTARRNRRSSIMELSDESDCFPLVHHVAPYIRNTLHVRLDYERHFTLAVECACNFYILFNDFHLHISTDALSALHHTVPFHIIQYLHSLHHRTYVGATYYRSRIAFAFFARDAPTLSGNASRPSAILPSVVYASSTDALLTFFDSPSPPGKSLKDSFRQIGCPEPFSNLRRRNALDERKALVAQVVCAGK